MDEAYAHVKPSDDKNFSKAGKDMVAPDGGWGYAVCIGVGLTFMLGFGSSSAFGILFHNFFMEQGGASGLTLVIGVYNGALSISGFLSGIALKRFSFRQVGLLGAGLFILGDILTIFVTKTYQLVFTFGLIRGAGFGVMIPVSFTAFNCYFVKKRTTMMSANQTMSSMASITFPILVTFLLGQYGFRGCLALVMAVDLHLLIAMLVMHPVEWHLLPSPIGSDVEKQRMLRDEKKKGIEIEETPMTVLTFEKPAIKETKKHLHESFEKNIIRKIYENIELDLLKHPGFLKTLIGLGFAFVSDVTYLAMEPMLLFSYGFTDVEVAFCVMLGATADLIARFLLAVYTYFYVVDSRKVFFFGTFITIFLRIALVSGSSFWYICAMTIVSGCVRCSIQVLFPLVLSTAAPEDRFPAALALHIIFSGVLMLLADPLIGIIYDLTGSYLYCFLAMSICCLICVLLWTPEYYRLFKQYFCKS